MADALEDFKPGKPLPIKISDIHFLIGACNKLIGNLVKLEESYKTDINAANAETDKFREKWKEARKISTKLDTELGYHRTVVAEANKMSEWRLSKRLRLALKTLEFAKRKFVKSDDIGTH
jgi:hypothetical protein